MSTSVIPTVQPLTKLREEEELFRSTVRSFAEEKLAPMVSSMDEAKCYDPTLIPQLFDLGLMGIEVPETYGGCGSSFAARLGGRHQLFRLVRPLAPARRRGDRRPIRERRAFYAGWLHHVTIAVASAALTLLFLKSLPATIDITAVPLLIVALILTVFFGLSGAIYQSKLRL